MPVETPAPPEDLAAALERLAARNATLPVRRTERLLLRPWQEADREPFAALNADPEVAEFLPAPLTRAESDQLVDRLRVDLARRGFGMFAVAHREARALVGMVGLAVPAWDSAAAFGVSPAVEIGWRLARPFWGQGYAYEAARDVLAWAFGELRLPRVLSWTTPSNRRSWALMERLGMARVGEFDHPRLEAGHPLQRHVLYALDAPWAVAAEPPAGSAAESAAEPAPPPSDAGAPAPALPHVWLDGDGCPRVVKEIVWKAVARGAVAATIVANRPLAVPKHRHLTTVVVPHGLDVADDWLVERAAPGDLVVTADVPLAAQLVPRGVAVVSPRGEWFTPSNIGEKLSLRDYFTEARESGLIEGTGPATFDERTKREFANGLDRWITAKRKELTPAPPRTRSP